MVVVTSPTQTSLTREQKEAVGLLSIGTFLEYFDVMLYVHMAVLLNELFFPKTDPFTASLLSAFAFCSTYFFRPFGALLFGYIGDKIGRKPVVVITTFLMAVSCMTIIILPPYAQIGITASWILTICRIIQGISSMGEIIGAEVYLTETIKSYVRYPAIALVSSFSVIGGFAALGIASLVTSNGLNWRYAFCFGVVIALIGTKARTALRETPDFADAKRQLKRELEIANLNIDELKDNSILKEPVNQKTSLYYFLMLCSSPIFFYFAYVHCGNILKDSFGFTPEQVIHQNLIVSIVQVFGLLFLTYLSSKIYALTIIKAKMIVLLLFILICPYMLYNTTTPSGLLLVQSFAVLFTSFGMIYLTKYFGHFGILVIIIPVFIGCVLGIKHFEKLEREVGNYPEKGVDFSKMWFV